MRRLNPYKKPVPRSSIERKAIITTLHPVNANVLESNSYWSEKNTSAESVVREKWRKCVPTINRLGVINLDIPTDKKHVGYNDIGVHLGVKRVGNIHTLRAKRVLVERRKPKLQKVDEGNET